MADPSCDRRLPLLMALCPRRHSRLQLAPLRVVGACALACAAASEGFTTDAIGPHVAPRGAAGIAAVIYMGMYIQTRSGRASLREVQLARCRRDRSGQGLAVSAASHGSCSVSWGVSWAWGQRVTFFDGHVHCAHVQVRMPMHSYGSATAYAADADDVSRWPYMRSLPSPSFPTVITYTARMRERVPFVHTAFYVVGPEPNPKRLRKRKAAYSRQRLNLRKKAKRRSYRYVRHFGKR